MVCCVLIPMYETNRRWPPSLLGRANTVISSLMRMELVNSVMDMVGRMEIGLSVPWDYNLKIIGVYMYMYET